MPTFWTVTFRVEAPADYTAERVEELFDEATEVASFGPKWQVRRMHRRGVRGYAEAIALPGRYEDEYEA